MPDTPIPQASPEPTPAGEYAGLQDGFERLWTPHRMAYVRGERPSDEAGDGCPFCVAPDKGDAEGLIVHRGEHCFVVLNLFPYNPGHVLVCPYRHVADLDELTDDEASKAKHATGAAILALVVVAVALEALAVPVLPILPVLEALASVAAGTVDSSSSTPDSFSRAAIRAASPAASSRRSPTPGICVCDCVEPSPLPSPSSWASPSMADDTRAR